MRLVGLIAVLVIASCGRDGPAGTADRFMDHYFIEADQQKALPLTFGPAHAKLKNELDSVKDIRRSGYGPRQARGNVYYERVSSTVTEKDKAARFVYNVSLAEQTDAGNRHVMVMVRRIRGWRVVNFIVRDGKARSVKPSK